MSMLQPFLSAILTTLLILIVLIAGIVIVILKLKIKKEAEYKTVKQKKAKTVLISNISLEYDNENNPFSEKMSFIDFKKKLEAILNNKKIEKIILLTDNFNISNAQIEEIYDIFEKLNKEKEVISISNLLTIDTYKKAALASQIYLEDNATSTVLFKGYSVKNIYMKDFFKKLGINVNVLHIGDYKSAGENYSKDKMSVELQNTLKKLSMDKLNIFFDFIKKTRNYDISKDFFEGKYIFKEDKFIINGRINKENFINSEENLILFKDYKIKNSKNKSKNIIAILSLDGVISEKEVSLKEVKERLKKIENEENLKSLIIEINSPGGSAYESSLIYNYIKNNIKVPIYISMKDVCASGGYYIASCGNKIYANKSTLTGSIGVVAIYPTFNNLLKKLGMKYDGIQMGKSHDLYDLREYLSHDSKELMINHMKEIYKEFKKIVSISRNIEDDILEPLAQGKVYYAEEAKKINLIDDIKTLDEILELIKNDLNLKDYKILKLEKDFNPSEFIKTKIPLLNNMELFSKPLFLSDIGIVSFYK